jgi:EAL domain-containing protein (putative c-di-GMP-specific phosphodiesterase class I)
VTQPSPITADTLARALAGDELVFHYQPKVSLLSGKVNGVEALIRWQRPDGGLVQPGDFIPLAEASGLIRDISRAMFPKLVADMVIIQDVCPDLVVSFNLTAADFETPDLVDIIRHAIGQYQVAPQHLQVELTESSVINSAGEARTHIQALVDMGIGLAMDDFGTGYASIDVLSQWPFSIVKLDHGLIQRMQTSEKSTTIVQASIRMAHQLGISVVAEGIESGAVYDFLLDSGCTDAQGFWMGRPMPLSDLLAFLRLDQRWSGIPIGLIHMAQLDHIQWRRSLIDMVMATAFNDGSPAGVRAFEAELNPQRCKLGKWYYGLGQKFAGYPAFDELERPHRQLHEIGSELVEAVRQGASREEITTLLRRLTRQSGIVISLLQELESEALLERGGFNLPDIAAG